MSVCPAAWRKLSQNDSPPWWQRSAVRPLLERPTPVDRSSRSFVQGASDSEQPGCMRQGFTTGGAEDGTDGLVVRRCVRRDVARHRAVGAWTGRPDLRRALPCLVVRSGDAEPSVGDFFGAWLGGLLFDLTGSDDIVWGLAIAIGVIAEVLQAPIPIRPIACARTMPG